MSAREKRAGEGASAQALRTHGHCVVPAALPTDAIAALDADFAPHFAETPFCEGDFYGRRTKRFGALLTRSPLAEQLVGHPLILGLAKTMLGPWCDQIALNLTQAVEIHPGASAQFPHRDQDMWGGDKGTIEYLVNVMWPLVPFTPDNGATRLWPSSHRMAPDSVLPEAEAVPVPLMPGDALVFLGSTLHGGGENRSGAPRRGVIVSYCLGWLKPFELQWLVYPPCVARHFDRELAALVGYQIHRPNLGNVEGQCPSVLLEAEVPAHRPAIDALRPDQAAALADYVARTENDDCAEEGDDRAGR